MKPIMLFLGGILLQLSVFSQAPQRFNYQAIARDGSGNVLASKPIGLRLSILDGSASGSVLYAETFSVTTNQLGLFSVQVGAGTVETGSFAGINWASGDKYIKTEMDPAGGSSYSLSGAAQLLSVPFSLYANNAGSSSSSHWNISGSDIYNNNSGNIGIGTSTPAYTLDAHAPGNSQIGLTEGVTGQTVLLSRYTNRFEIEPSDGFQVSVGGSAAPDFWVGPTGYVGVGTTTPSTIFNVSGGDITIDNANSYLIANSTVTNNYCGVNMRVQGNSKAWMFWDNTNSDLNLNTAASGIRNDLVIGTSGNVGIGTIPLASTDKLVVENGYVRDESANPFFYTNATTTGVAGGFSMRVLNSAKAWMYWDDANSVLRMSTAPSGSSYNDMTIAAGGYVGLGTTTPQCPFDVEASAAYYDNPSWNQFNNGGYSSPQLSIYSAGDILCHALVAFSDARIKNIKGISNSAADLETLNKIEVTDYSMKDTLMYGRRLSKKVIAQQVEQVDPEVVTKITNYIPNVYQFTSKIEKSSQGYLLTFSHPHHISQGAKKIRIQDRKGMEQYDIVSIPSENEVLVSGNMLTSGKVFVYGEQVKDFRTVDYEGLATLNISATQQLSKIIEKQQKEIDELTRSIEKLEKASKP